MLVIGLTGSIASGKSTVTRYLRVLGAPVIDADAIVHELQAPGTPLLAAIASEFGPAVINPNGSLNRSALGQIIFADPPRRKVLETLVHPAVRARMFADVDRYRQMGEPAVVLDVPLLIEGGLHRHVDQVWVVAVEPSIQMVRLIARDHLSPEAAAARVGAQMDLAEKRRYAHLVIENSGTVAETEAQVKRAWDQVLETTST
jgi:dephospho-CoA kinase